MEYTYVHACVCACACICVYIHMSFYNFIIKYVKIHKILCSHSNMMCIRVHIILNRFNTSGNVPRQS